MRVFQQTAALEECSRLLTSSSAAHSIGLVSMKQRKHKQRRKGIATIHTLAGFVLSAWLAGCTTLAMTPSDVGGPETWGASDNVTHLRHLYFSEQPDAEALRVARSKGVTTVIDLREPGESQWNERVAAEEAGIEYLNIPIKKESDTLDSATLRAISAAVEAQNGQPVLLHCSSGNRASAWLAVHLIEDHAMSKDDALVIARKAGLSMQGMERRVATYLRTSRN